MKTAKPKKRVAHTRSDCVFSADVVACCSPLAQEDEGWAGLSRSRGERRGLGRYVAHISLITEIHLDCSVFIFILGLLPHRTTCFL